MKKFNYKSRKGFTLIELLVVIGILAVLAAIAIPSVAGLIDRANVSADKTNSNEMTNAIERFTSEYELYCQDIASGVLKDADNNGTPDDMDSAQGRVFNVTGAMTRGDIETLEVAQDAPITDDMVAIYRDTKYPANAKTMQLVVQNYTKTSSSTFEPKQSDMHYWYSPDCGVVVFAKPNADVVNDLNSQIQSGTDAKGNDLGPNTQWIDLTLDGALNDSNNNNGGNASQEPTVTKAVRNETTLVEYDDIKEAMDAASPGDLLKIYQDINITGQNSSLANNEIALDLNGHTLTTGVIWVKNLIDTSGGRGLLVGIVLTGSQNGDSFGWLPLKDSANNGYRVFKFTLQNTGEVGPFISGTGRKFSAILKFENNDAFKYLEENADMLRFSVAYENTSSSVATAVTQYVEANKNGDGDYKIYTIALFNLQSGKTLTYTLSLISDDSTRYSFTTEAKTVTLQ